MPCIQKAAGNDLRGRFREVVSDPINFLIHRVADAGIVINNQVRLHNGHMVPLCGPGAYYDNFSDILIINRGVHEPLEEYVFQEIIKKLQNDCTMLELGSYWAHYSMWLKKVRPNSKVYLIESDPLHLQVGKDNFSNHSYIGDFRCESVGIGKFEIDDFLNKEDIGTIDIVHADVQGYEVEMLLGASEALKDKKIRYLFISTHSNGLHKDTLNILIEANYRIEVDSDFDYSSTSFDGFILASNPHIASSFADFRPVGRCEMLGITPDEQIERLLELHKRHRQA